MSFDEKLFGFGFRFFSRLFAKKDKDNPHAASLDTATARLSFFARALSGQPLQIKEAENVGGISGPSVYLPAKMDLCSQADDNGRAMLWRTIYSCQVLRLDLFLPQGASLSSFEQAVVSLLLTPFVLRTLGAELPQHGELLSFANTLLPTPAKQSPHGLSVWLRHLLGISASDAETSDGHDAPWHLPDAQSIETVEQALAKLPNVMQSLPAQRFPRQRLPDDLKLIGMILPRETLAAPKKTTKQITREDALPSGTELAKKVRQKIRKLQIEQNQLADNPLTHAFEKVKTADDYRGGQKTLDGEDELADHADALSELDLRSVIRSHTRTKSIYRADVDLDTDIAEIVDETVDDQTVIPYDEWDFAKSKYRPGFCRVLVRRAEPAIAASDLASRLHNIRTTHKRSIKELQRRLTVLRNERKWQGRQLEGPELDLPALVDRHANVCAGHTPPDRLYLQQRLARRDIATLLLLDSSMSMDSWVENHRVMDLAREALVVLGDVLSRFDDQVSIAGFYSNTHEDCRYLRYKDFSDPFSTAYPRLLSQPPCGYTRIGPALRHATSVLGKVAAKKRLLLLISDGKPTDYDRYEGRYGIADCRQAIREARQQGMFVRMLAIDGRAKAHLAEMFGPGHYQVLSHPQKLVTILTALYTQLAG